MLNALNQDMEVLIQIQHVTKPNEEQIYQQIEIYSIKYPKQVLFWYLSCFCAFCIDEDWDQYANHKHTGPWMLKKRITMNTNPAQQRVKTKTKMHFMQWNAGWSCRDWWQFFILHRIREHRECTILCDCVQKVEAQIDYSRWLNLFTIGEELISVV